VRTDLFEWDDAKAARNIMVHGVEFDEARTVFEDPFAITIPDDLHSEEEDRSIILGLSLLSRVLLVVYVERHEDEQEMQERLRIISARKATPSERFQYESNR
jgi:uncharacterized protein